MSEQIETGHFSISPAWLYFDVSYEKNDRSKLVNCLELPKIIELQNVRFKLILAQILVNQNRKESHFKGIFLLNIYSIKLMI